MNYEGTEGLELESPIKIRDKEYVVKAYEPQKDSWSLLYKEDGRYSRPVELAHGIQNERDVDQLMLQAEETGVQHLLEP